MVDSLLRGRHCTPVDCQFSALVLQAPFGSVTVSLLAPSASMYFEFSTPLRVVHAFGRAILANGGWWGLFKLHLETRILPFAIDDPCDHEVAGSAVSQHGRPPRTVREDR